MTATQAFRSNKLIQLIAVMGTSFLTGNASLRFYTLPSACGLTLYHRRWVCGSHWVRGMDVGVRKILLPI